MGPGFSRSDSSEATKKFSLDIEAAFVVDENVVPVRFRFVVETREHSVDSVGRKRNTATNQCRETDEQFRNEPKFSGIRI